VPPLPQLAMIRDLCWSDLVEKQPVIEMGTISGQLRNVIEASGMTQDALAQASGVSASVISRFRAGERTLTLKTVDKLAAVLELRLCGGPDEGQ
jgi:ribosome-binding protein aMBF1 (putative translation factor)